MENQGREIVLQKIEKEIFMLEKEALEHTLKTINTYGVQLYFFDKETIALFKYIQDVKLIETLFSESSNLVLDIVDEIGFENEIHGTNYILDFQQIHTLKILANTSNYKVVGRWSFIVYFENGYELSVYFHKLEFSHFSLNKGLKLLEKEFENTDSNDLLQFRESVQKMCDLYSINENSESMSLKQLALMYHLKNELIVQVVQENDAALKKKLNDARADQNPPLEPVEFLDVFGDRVDLEGYEEKGEWQFTVELGELYMGEFQMQGLLLKRFVVNLYN